MGNISMSEINAVNKLKSAGLFLNARGTSKPCENGYTIAKPKQARGNTRKNWEVLIVVKGGPKWHKVRCDAPISYLYPKNNKWIFRVGEFTSSVEYGDFEEEFASIDDAVSAVLDYYFGNPSKMNPPELFEEE